MILEEIKNNPGIYVINLAQRLHEKMSLRTLKRKLNNLKKSGHIEFRGSKKTGGYYLV
jgi:predicted transcriptional regulator